MKWIIERTSFEIALPDYKKCNNDAKRADKKIKFCSKCNRCWEQDKATMRNLKQKKKGDLLVKHYKSFPSYGKKREECEECKSNNE